MRMRTLLIALLSFAAGVLVMLLVTGHRSPPSAETPAVAASGGASPAPASSSTDTDDSDSSDNWPNQGPSPEQVIYAQPNMVRQAVSKLSPRVPDKTNLYLVAF
ncbi:MAG TPA: peptidase C13, partial [Dyella sp.]|nr:peptidase C13 [Dyella sp.]